MGFPHILAAILDCKLQHRAAFMLHPWPYLASIRELGNARVGYVQVCSGPYRLLP